METEEFKLAKNTDIKNFTINQFIVDNGLLEFIVDSNLQREVVLTDDTATMIIRECFSRIYVTVTDPFGDEWHCSYEQYKSLDGEIVWKVI